MSLYLQNRMVLGTVGSCCCCYHHDQITIFLNVLCLKSFPSQSILHSLSEPFASNVSLITFPSYSSSRTPVALSQCQIPDLGTWCPCLWCFSCLISSHALWNTWLWPQGTTRSSPTTAALVPLGLWHTVPFPFPHPLGPANSLSSPVQACCHLHALPPLSVLLCIPRLTSTMASISGIYNHQYDGFLLHAARFLKEGIIYIYIWNFVSPKLSHTEFGTL